MSIDIETIGWIAFAFAAAALIALVVERRMDVLHGPYIEGRARRRVPLAAGLMPAWVRRFADRMRWSARNAVYLATVVAG